jgi:ribose transport system substrate-binding protein
MSIATVTRRRQSRKGACVAISILLAGVLALTSCTTDKASSASAGQSAAQSGGSGVPSFVKNAQAVVDADYQGNFLPVPTAGPTAVRGKNVWLISCGEAFQACADHTKSFRRAADALGWKLTVADSKADPSVAAAAIQQAIAAKADLIAIIAVDCAGIKNALLQAKDAGIPVVASFAADCNESGKNDQPLFTASVKVKGENSILDLYERWGADKADYIIAKSNGKAKVIDVANVDQLVQVHNEIGFRREMTKCTTCSIVDRVKFSFSQVPTGLEQKLSAALLQHPEATAVYIPLDALMSLGAGNALKQAPNRNLIIIGGECLDPNLTLIKQGQQTACLGWTFKWFAWSLADVANRILAGQAPSDIPNEGSGWLLIDKDHNFPASGTFTPPVDYESEYKKVWGASR